MINPLAGQTVEVKILYIRNVVKVRVFSPIEGEPIFFLKKKDRIYFSCRKCFFSGLKTVCFQRKFEYRGCTLASS